MPDAITVVQPLGDGWEAVMTWPKDEPVQGGPSSLTVRPEDPDAVPFGGIATPLLRGIDFRRAADAARRKMDPDQRKWMTDDSVWLAPGIVDIPKHAKDEISRSGLTDTALVLVAAWYLQVVSEGTPKPVAVIAKDLDRSEVTVRGWLSNARRKGFMTGSPGRAGGRLTPDSLRALANARRHQPD